MKRAGILGALGLGVLALAVYAGGPARGQEKGAAPKATGPTKVALVNLREVFKGYSKFNNLNDEVKKKVEEIEKVFKRKTETAQKLQEEYKDPKTPQKRKDALENELRLAKVELEDFKAKEQRNIMKMQDEQLTQLYREVDGVVRDYAQKNGIHMVLRYNEDWGEDYHKPENTVRRMHMSFWPMYFEDGLDITAAVRTAVNQKYAGGDAKPAKDVKPAGGMK